jgi:hypothetical protein
MDWLTNPTVIVGILGLVAAILSPSVAAWIKRKENGRIAAQAAAVAAESRRIEVTEQRLAALMERQHAEIAALDVECAELRQKVQELERRGLRVAQKFDRILATLLDEARLVRDQVREREDHDDMLPNVERLVKAVQDARGDFFNGERIA